MREVWETAFAALVALAVASFMLIVSTRACADSRWVVMELPGADEPLVQVEVFRRPVGEQTWIFVRSSPVKGYLHATDCQAGCARVSLQVFVAGSTPHEVAARLSTATRVSDMSNVMPFETYRSSKTNVLRVCNGGDNDDNGTPAQWMDKKLCEFALGGQLP